MPHIFFDSDPVTRWLFRGFLGLIVFLAAFLVVMVLCFVIYYDQLRRLITTIKSAPGSVARRVWNGMGESGRRLPSMYVFDPNRFASEMIADGGLRSLTNGQNGFVPRHHRKGMRGLDRT